MIFFFIFQVTFLSSKVIENQSCGCTAGKGTCAHIVALVYQLAHYKTLKMTSVPDVVSKTSCPQQWHVPPQTHVITPRSLTDVKFVKPKPTRDLKSEQCVCGTLYNPVNTEFPDTDFMTALQQILPLHSSDIQLLQVMPDNIESAKTTETTFGKAF